MTRVYVPRDSSALALGADAVAAAIVREAAARGVAVELVRNGSRGLLYLEPLVEVETPRGRVATRTSRKATSARCSTRAFWKVASTRATWASSTRFRI